MRIKAVIYIFLSFYPLPCYYIHLSLTPLCPKVDGFFLVVVVVVPGDYNGLSASGVLG